MVSHYDPEKKCRVGLMDEKQFFSEANEVNGIYFKALLEAWRNKGGSQQWGAGGLGLRSRIKGKEVGICFLAPAYAGKKDRIELSFTNLAKQMGPVQCEKLKLTSMPFLARRSNERTICAGRRVPVMIQRRDGWKRWSFSRSTRMIRCESGSFFAGSLPWRCRLPLHPARG